MKRDDVVARIGAHRAELRALGVQELSLFGSFARGDEDPESDLDFVVQFERNTFDNYMALKELL